MSEQYSRITRLLERTPKFYPNASACLGSEIGFFHDRHWWHATGPAKEQFSLVEPDIQAQLNRIFQNRYTRTVHFRLFMIGRSAEAAIPTVMFFCEEKGPRKEAQGVVDKEQLLQKLPGFRTGHLARQPEVGILIQPAKEYDGTHHSGHSDPTLQVYFDPSHPVQAIGMLVFAKHSNGLLRRATANAVFDGQKCVYMSVAHIFVHGDQEHFSTTIDDDSEYDFGSGTEYDDDDELVDATSRASISSLDESSGDEVASMSTLSGSSTCVEDIPVFPTVPSGSRMVPPVAFTNPVTEPEVSDSSVTLPDTKTLKYLGYVSRHSTDMDWALIVVDNSDVAKILHQYERPPHATYDHSTRHDYESAIQISAHTSRGLVSGHLSDSATYMRLPNSTTFQEVHEVALEVPLDWGDCGSGIFDAITAEPYGHVVASSKTRSIAYIMAASQVSMDSKTQWVLPPIEMLDAIASDTEQVSEHYIISPSRQDFRGHEIVPTWNMSFESLDSSALGHCGEQQTRLGRLYITKETDLRDKGIGLLSVIKGQRPPQSLPIIISLSIGVPLFDGRQPLPIPPIGRAVDPFRTMFRSSHPRVAVEELKYYCSRYFGTYGMGVHWIPTVYGSPHTFLSLLYMTSVHHDTIHGRIIDSVETSALRQDVIHMVGYNLLYPKKSVDDYNIIAVLQLIMGELIGRAEEALLYHQAGLEKMIQQRGGLLQLGLDGRIASAVSWTAVVSCIFREAPLSIMHHDYCASHSSKPYAPTTTIPESPLYCPHGMYNTLPRSGMCREDALDLLCNIRMMIDIFLHNTTTSGRSIYGTSSLYENIIMQPGVAVLRNNHILKPEDWRYEAIRIASIIQATAMVKRLPLSETLYELCSTNVETGMSLSTQNMSMVFGSSERSVLSMDYDDGISVTSSSAHITSTTSGMDNRSTTGSLYSEITSATSCCQSGSRSADLAAAQRTSRHHTEQSSGSVTRSSYPSFHPPVSSKFIPEPDMSVDLLRSLKNALENSNLSDCWNDMAGVLLWIGLMAGAASRNIEDLVLKKYFSATAMRAAFMLFFEHPEAIHATVLRMHAIIEGLSSPRLATEDRVRLSIE